MPKRQSAMRAAIGAKMTDLQKHYPNRKQQIAIMLSEKRKGGIKRLRKFSGGRKKKAR